MTTNLLPAFAELIPDKKMYSFRMHRQICAYIDILGGADLFRGKDRYSALKFLSWVHDFEDRMNDWSHHFPKKRRSSALVKTFSDNIFVAFPLRSNPNKKDAEIVNIFLTELTDQILKLFMAGFPVRGAVTIGPLLFTDRNLFGPALLDAVQLEKKAGVPRILLSESVIKKISLTTACSNMVMRDSDGKAFLHYLANLAPFVYLKEHKKIIERGLIENRNRLDVLQKYEWLARYHNFVAKYSEPGESIISIDSHSSFSALPNSLLHLTINKQKV